MDFKLRLITVIGLEHDMGYLSHHINFYKDQVDSLHYILNTPTKAHRNLEKAQELISRAGDSYNKWIGVFDSKTKVKKINNAIQEFSDSDWIINPDADEFHRFDGLTLKEAVSKYNEYECLFGEFVDRVAKEGQPALREGVSIWDQYPIDASRTLEIGATTLRPSIFSAKHRLTGCHATTKYSYKNYDGPLAKIYHFKWTASTEDKLKVRAKTFKEFGFPWWEESQRALERFYGDDL